MNATVTGNALVITSSVKVEEIEKLKKAAPEALTLYKEENGKKNPDFIVGVEMSCPACVEEFAVVFDGKAYDTGFATATVGLPNFEGKEEAQNYVADHYGAALTKLRAWEQTVPAVLARVAAERSALLELIHV